MSLASFPWTYRLLGAPGPQPLERVMATGATQAELCDAVGLPTALAGLFRLEREGRVARDLVVDGRAWVASVPLRPPPGPPQSLDRAVLSSSAWLRRDREGLVLESSRGWARVVVHEAEVMHWVHELCTPRGAPELFGAQPTEVKAAFVELLAWCGIVEEAAQARAPEDAWRWPFPDRIFHESSRSARGKTWPFRGGPRSPPPIHRHIDGSRLELPTPDMERLRRDDPPLAEVMENRRSERLHGDAPITRAQLGELLHRTVRDRRARPETTVDDATGLRGDRPHPSGGACYPLDLWLAIGRCEGLESGLYRYETDALVRGSEGREVSSLLERAARAAGVEAPPQVLVIVAAELARSTWPYGDLAYRLVLLEVGVVMQSMALAATAMGLAACPLGTGDGDTFATLTGLDPLAVPAVGELMLGSRPPGS